MPKRSSKRSYDEAAAARLWQVSADWRGFADWLEPGRLAMVEWSDEEAPLVVHASLNRAGSLVSGWRSKTGTGVTPWRRSRVPSPTYCDRSYDVDSALIMSHFGPRPSF
jgi:hypothetical protein